MAFPVVNPEIGAGLIGAGSNLASGAINLAVQNAWLQRSEEWARQDATTAYNRQLDFWRMQNAYNTPAAQMKRYLDAGLNPNLIYGQQQGAIAPASVPQAASQASGVPNLPQGMFDPVANALMNKAQIERLQNQNTNDNLLAFGQLERWANENNVSVSQALEIQQQIRVADKNIEKMDAEIRLLDEDTLAKSLENQFNSETFDARVGQAKAEFQLSQEKAEMYVKIQNAVIYDLYASANLKGKQAWQISQLTPAEVRLKNMMASYYQNAANKTLTENDVLKLEKSLKEYFGSAQVASEIMRNLSSGNLVEFALLRRNAITAVDSYNNRNN